MDIFTGIFALFIGALSIWMSIKFLRTYFKVKQWNRVDAKVTEKEIVLQEEYSNTRRPCKLKVKYRYNVDGSELIGSKVYLAEVIGGRSSHMRSDAERRIKKIDDNMLIHVDPADPKNSVIFCDGAGLFFFTLCTGFFAILFGISKFV